MEETTLTDSSDSIAPEVEPLLPVAAGATPLDLAVTREAVERLALEAKLAGALSGKGKKEKKSPVVEDKGSEAEGRTAQLMESVLVKKILAKHGKHILARASDSRLFDTPRIPTNIFMLDYALGGGFPAGRFNLVWGHTSSAKTTSLLRTVAAAQKMCARCWTFPTAGKTGCACGDFREAIIAYLDTEGSLDLPWARRMGVDLERFVTSTPEYTEQALDIGEALIREAGCDLLVVDSIAAMSPAKEVEESVGKDLPGLSNRVLSRGIRKLQSAQNTIKNEEGRLPTVMLVSQMRINLGVMFGNPETVSGGNAPKFASSTITKFWAANKTETDETTGLPLYVDINFKVEKNKVSVAKVQGEYRLILSDTDSHKKGDVYDEHTMLKLAESTGVLVGSGPRWEILGQVFRGKSLVERELITNSEFKKMLWDTLMTTTRSE